MVPMVPAVSMVPMGVHGALGAHGIHGASGTDGVRGTLSTSGVLNLNLNLTTLEGFTTMVANKGLEKTARAGPPEPTALLHLQRMRCELTLSRTHLLVF